MQLFFEMFGLLLPPPRVWRALARAEMRARAAAAHARAFCRPRACAWPMSDHRRGDISSSDKSSGHSNCGISEQRPRSVAVGDGAADDRDALRARRGPLEESAVSAEHVLARIPGKRDTTQMGSELGTRARKSSDTLNLLFQRV